MSLRRPIVLLSLLGVLTTGCQIGESQRPPCDCPNSEATVSSIDWLGDGSAADEILSVEGVDGWPDLTVIYTRLGTLEEAQTAVDSLYGRLQAAGLVASVPIPPGEPNLAIELGLQDAIVTIPPPVVDSPEIEVEVGVVAGDARAAEALQPLIDALGTID